MLRPAAHCHILALPLKYSSSQLNHVGPPGGGGTSAESSGLHYFINLILTLEQV